MAKRPTYATQERVVKINPQNLDLWKKYLNGKRTLSDTTRSGYENDMMMFLHFCF